MKVKASSDVIFPPPPSHHAQHAEAAHKVMQNLGYSQYVVQGGDWGAFIVRWRATLYPDSVKAVHRNMGR